MPRNPVIGSVDIILLSDIVRDVAVSWNSIKRRHWFENGRPQEGEAVGDVILPVPVSSWDRSEPIVRDVVTRLAFVETVAPLEWIGETGGSMRGWRIQCRGAY